MNYFKDKDRRKGLIGTILFHLAMLIVFIFMGMTYMDPPEKTGLLLHFGTTGGGDEVVEDANDASEPVSEPTPQPEVEPQEAVADETAPEDIQADEILTDPNSDVAIPTEEVKNTEVAEKPKEEVKEKEKEVSESLQRMIDKMQAQQNTKSGDGPGEGDDVEGSQDGDVGEKMQGQSGGNGKEGIGFDLGDRTAKHLPEPKSAIQESGKVIVDIKVDKYGNVTWAKAGARGSTITNKTQFKEAEDAAYKAKFSVDVKAVGEQKGTITYNFVLN